MNKDLSSRASVTDAVGGFACLLGSRDAAIVRDARLSRSQCPAPGLKRLRVRREGASVSTVGRCVLINRRAKRLTERNEGSVADEIFREVDDELRAERLRNAARRYAGVGIGAVVLVGIAAGAWEYHVSRANQAAAVSSATYLQALRDVSPAAGPSSASTPLTDVQKKALAQLETVAKGSPAGLATLAKFQVAATNASHGQLPDALTVWNAISQDQSVSPTLRDLAALYWCQWQVDSGDEAAIRSRLSLLTGKGKPFASLANEVLATLDLRTGKLDDARKLLSSLAQDVQAPEGVRMRANTVMQTLNQPG